MPAKGEAFNVRKISLFIPPELSKFPEFLIFLILSCRCVLQNKICVGYIIKKGIKNVNRKILCLCECAVMIALAVIFDLISKGISVFFPNPWINGGGISIGMIPLIFISYRHGPGWGIITSFAYSGIQLITGWSPPPAGTPAAFILCVLLDYVLAFTVLGIAPIFAKPFKNKPFGYAFGAFAVCMLRFICSFLSGAILWGEYITWGFESVWLYSFVYNISYMLPNAILTSVIIYALCTAFTPNTLKPGSIDKKTN